MKPMPVEYVAVFRVTDVNAAIEWCERYLGAHRESFGRHVLYLKNFAFKLCEGESDKDQHISLIAKTGKDVEELAAFLVRDGGAVVHNEIVTNGQRAFCVVRSPQGIYIQVMWRITPLEESS